MFFTCITLNLEHRIPQLPNIHFTEPIKSP